MDAKSEQVDARMAAIEARFGRRLSSEQLAAVRASVEGTVDLAAALREAQIDDGEEPILCPVAE